MYIHDSKDLGLGSGKGASFSSYMVRTKNSQWLFSQWLFKQKTLDACTSHSIEAQDALQMLIIQM